MKWRCPSSVLKTASRNPNFLTDPSRNSHSFVHRSDLFTPCFDRSSVLWIWSNDLFLSDSSSPLGISRSRDFHVLSEQYRESAGLSHEPSENLGFSRRSSSGFRSLWASTFLNFSSRSDWLRRKDCEPRVRSRGISSVAEESSETDATATATAGGEASQKVAEIVNEVTGLTLMEIADLTEVLRKKFGVDEMPIMTVMMPGMAVGGVGGAARAGGAKAEEKKPEKTAFDLKLESFDAASKIKIIKEVRTFTDLGLKEAKDLVEMTPTLLKKGVLKEEAEKIIERMKAVGANVVME